MRYLSLVCLYLVLFSCTEDVEVSWVKVEGDHFHFGDDKGKENESPAVPIKVKDFYLTETEITVAQFSVFVNETGYVTTAEKKGTSLLFQNGAWIAIDGVSWNNPMGQKEGVENLLDHPVTHLSYADMMAFCKWSGGRLPSEVELEFAMKQGGTTKMNIWTGDFPSRNDAADGFVETNPVKHYKPNDIGLYGLHGNVWEQCADIYHFEIHDKLAFDKKRSQKAYKGQGFDIGNNDNAQEFHVIKGGSFLCHKSYCAGYRASARQKMDQNETYGHIGFRVAKDK